MSRWTTVPRVSVVIPAYNAEQHIDRALQSVLSQTRPVDQIIVVNDGSKDGTAQRLAAYGQRIQVITIPNGGVSNARNTGLKLADGELIAFLDADDHWLPEKIAEQLAVFERHPEVQFCCTNFRSIDEATGASHDHFARWLDPRRVAVGRVLGRPVAQLLTLNFVGTCSNVMFTRELLAQSGLFNTELRQAEDFDLWLRMAALGDFYLHPGLLVEKVAHGFNLTSRYDETLKFHERVVLAFRSQHDALFRAAPALETVYRRGLAEVRYELAGILFAKGHKSEGYAYLSGAWAVDRSARNSARVLKRAVRRLVSRPHRRVTAAPVKSP